MTVAERIDIRFSKYSSGHLSTIDLQIIPDINFKSDITELKNTLISDFSLSIAFVNVDDKTILRISIYHSDETLENIKRIISDIFSGNDSLLFMYEGLRNYYSFLCQMFMKYLDLKI